LDRKGILREYNKCYRERWRKFIINLHGKEVSKIPESIRYSEKRRLVKYDLYVDLFKLFDLKVVDVVPVRDVFIIFTDKEKKILKKVDYSPEDLKFIYAGISYIKRSFDRVMSFTRTKGGELFTLWKGDMYCVLDLIEGRECEFSNPLDVNIAAEGLAQLHNAGEGFRYDTKDKNLVGTAVYSFQRKLQEMKFFKSLAELHDIKSDFDSVFLQNVDYHIEQIEKSINSLRASSYLKLCSEEDKITLCHHDLAHHNIIINNEEAYFVDFDYAVIDLKVHDLCNFINEAIKNYAYDIVRANEILIHYCKFNSLDRREREVLSALMSFPEDFYSISKDYYSRRKDWDEEVFLDRLKRKVEYKEDREEFLQNFFTKTA
jgi:CotS family spore coat protein